MVFNLRQDTGKEMGLKGSSGLIIRHYQGRPLVEKGESVQARGKYRGKESKTNDQIYD
jgi:hypothetical protein